MRGSSKNMRKKRPSVTKQLPPQSPNTRGFRGVSRRFDSLFAKSTPQTVENEPLPEAKIDLALVGVEHAGKSTFFKQLTSVYKPQDFQQLIHSDGRSQAEGTLLKVTLAILNMVHDQLVTLSTKSAAETLLTSITQYSLTEKTAEAIKTLWNDVIFLHTYRMSVFYQPQDFLVDVANCHKLLDSSFAVSKSLHLKLHNQTHGYNSTKFTFESTQMKENLEKKQDNKPVAEKPQKKSMDDASNSSDNQTSIKSEPIGVLAKQRNPNVTEIRSRTNRESITKRIRRVSINAVTRTMRGANVGLNFETRKNTVKMFDVGGLFEKRTDWEYFLKRSNVAIFFTSLSDYSTVAQDGSDENLLTDSLSMFQVLCESEFLRDRKIFIALTKLDVLEQKLTKMRVPLNRFGLFPDAPNGDLEFDVAANVEYIKEKFLKITETENSFLTRDNIEFKMVNCLDLEMVKDLFDEAVGTIKATKVSDTPDEREESVRNLIQPQPRVVPLNDTKDIISPQPTPTNNRRSRVISMKLQNFSLKDLGANVRNSLKNKSKNRMRGMSQPSQDSYQEVDTLTFRNKTKRESKRRTRGGRNRKTIPPWKSAV